MHKSVLTKKLTKIKKPFHWRRQHHFRSPPSMWCGIPFSREYITRTSLGNLSTGVKDRFLLYIWIYCFSSSPNNRVRISARVRESTLTKTPTNESTRVQLDSSKLSEVSHKLNTGEWKDSCKVHQGESKLWTLVALYQILPLKQFLAACDTFLA